MPNEARRATVLVAGDRTRGDDGAPIAALVEPGGAVCDDVAIAARVVAVGQVEADVLAEALANGRCVVVDAVRGPSPGTVVCMPLERLGASSMAPASTHTLPLPATIELAAALGADLRRGVFVGIAGADFTLGAPLTPAVAAALGELRRTVAFALDPATPR
jgi:hydrogenase maturation protease